MSKQSSSYFSDLLERKAEEEIKSIIFGMEMYDCKFQCKKQEVTVSFLHVRRSPCITTFQKSLTKSVSPFPNGESQEKRLKLRFQV